MQHIESADILMFVFSLTEPQTLANLLELKEKIKEVSKSTCPCVLVGNKSDLAHMREITAEQVSEAAKTLNCSYYETSAATSSKESLDELFYDTAKLAAVHKNAQKIEEGKPTAKSVKGIMKRLKRFGSHQKRGIAPLLCVSPSSS